MPLSYQELSDLFHEARAGSPELLGKVTLPQFAEELNRTSGTQDYSAGLHDNWIKQASASINRGLEWTGAPEASGQAFKKLAESVGVEGQTGFDVGHGLPRSIVNLLPIGVAAGLAPFTGGGSLLAAAGAIGAGSLAGAETYTETDSPAAGLVSGVATAALPKVFQTGGQLALKAIGVPLTEGVDAATGQFIRQRLEKTIGQRLASYAGGQAAAFTDFEAAHQAQSVVEGQGLVNPFTKTNLFGTIAGQLPFLALDIPRVARATPHVEIAERSTTTSAKVGDAKIGLTGIPDRVAPEGEVAETNFSKFNDIVAQKVKIAQDDTIPADEKAKRLASLDVQETRVVENQSKQSVEQKADMLFDEPVVKPKVEDTTGLTKLGGSGVVTSMYDMMFKKLQAGDLTEGGGPSNALKKAYPEFQAGNIKSAEDLQKFFNPPKSTEPVGVTETLAELTRRNAPDPTAHLMPIVESAKQNVVAPVVDLPTAVDKTHKANETNIELGSPPITNVELTSKAEALLSDDNDLTPTAEKVTQAVATESADRAETVQKVTQRTTNKRQRQADAMSYMAERERAQDFPKDLIEGWLQRAGSLAGGQVDRYTNDVAAVFQNWDAGGREGGPKALNAMLSTALQNAVKPEIVETRSFKSDGKLSNDKVGQRKYYTNRTDAATDLIDIEKRYRDSLGSQRDKDTTAFAVRKVVNKDQWYIEQRVYKRTEAIYEGSLGEATDINATSQAQQDIVETPRGVQEDLDTQAHVLGHAPDIVHEADKPDASAEVKQAGEVVKGSTKDFAAALRFASDDTIQEIIGFGKKGETPPDANQFRERVATIVENVGSGHTDPEFLNDRLTEKGVSFKTPDDLMEFMDSPEFVTALGVARDLVHESQHPDIRMDAVGAQGESLAFRTPTLQPKPFGLLGGLSNLFDKWYKQAGLTDTTLQGYTQSSLRVAALFRQLDDSRVGEVLNDVGDHTVYGASVQSLNEKFPGAMWLSEIGKQEVRTPDQLRIAHKVILGHELWHSLENQHKLGQLSSEDTRIMNRLVDHLENSSTEDRHQILKEFYDELIPKWAKSDFTLSVVLRGADSASESRANLGGMLATSMTEFRPRSVRSLIDFLPKPIGDFITTAVKYMKQIVSSVNGAQILNEHGLIEPVTNEFSHPVLNEFTTGFLALSRQLDHVEQLTQHFVELQNLEPVGFRQLQKDYLLNPLKVSSMVVKAESHEMYLNSELAYLMGFKKEPTGFENELQDKKSFFGGLMQSFSKFVNPALQFAEANPTIRPAVWLPMEYLKQGHDFTRRSLTPFSGKWNPDTGEIEFGASMNHMRRLQSDEGARKVLNDIQLWQNDNNKPFVKEDGRTFEDPTLVAGLSKQQLGDVVSANLAIRASNEINQGAYLNAKRATLIQRMAQTISGQNPSWKPNQAKELASNMLAANEMLADPTKVVQAQEMFRQIQSKIAPEQFIQLQQFGQEGLQALGKLKTFYDQHPEFTSERRYGGYAISYLKDDGTTGRVSGRSSEDAERKLKQVADVKEVLDRITPETVTHTEGMSKSFIETAQGFEDVVKARMKQILGDESFDKIKDVSFTDPLIRELAARQLGEKQPYRRGASGRETLDMLENHLHYTNALTRSMGSHYIQNELALQLGDPELAGRDDLKAYARQHVANFLAPDSPAGRALVSTNFLYYMGMNISTTMMESVQSFFSLVPTLIREGGGIINSYRNVLGTARKIGEWALTKRWDNPEHSMLMERAGREHNIQLGSFSEFLDPEEHGAVNISRLMLRKDPATMSDIVTKPLGQFSQLARSYYSIFTNFNHRIALLSAFDHFRESGMGFEEAYDNANRVNHVVNFSGGRAARPVGWFQPADPVGRTAAQGLYSLASYQFGMISMMGRYLREGFGPVRDGVSPWQRTQARQAAVVMLGTQLAAAGALGLPAVGAGVAVLEQMFPELELNKMMRKNLASLGGDDQELGGIISDMALHGVVNQIGGVDLGSRFALGNILGTSSYDGFSVDNFLGPTGNLLKNMAMGVQQASQGDLGRAAQSVLPQGFKRMIDLYRNDWVARDQRGSLLLQPTLGEKFAMMIGFSPKRLTTLRDAQRIMQRSQQIERNDIIRFHQDLADRVRQGDYQGVRQALVDKTRTDKTYDPREGAQAIADILASRTLPVDLRRMGAKQSAQDDQEILRTYALTGPPPSELQRLRIKQGIMNRLGLGAQVTPSQIQSAQMTDQLQYSDPLMMRSTARSRVSRLLHPSHAPTLWQSLVLPTSE